MKSLIIILIYLSIVFASTKNPKNELSSWSENKKVGSFNCLRCHTTEYANWSNSKNRNNEISCEDCHGNGRHHVLAPTNLNIKKKKNIGIEFNHFAKLIKDKNIAKNKKIKIDLYVMTYCPYGIDAEMLLFPLVDKWKENIELNINYIAHLRDDNKIVKEEQVEEDPFMPADGKCRGSNIDNDGTSTFTSLHGKKEINESLIQLIIKKYFPKKHIPYIYERNLDIEVEWKDAAYNVGLDESKISFIENKIYSEEAEELLRINIRMADSLKINGSPTIYINDIEYTDGLNLYGIEQELCIDNREDSNCINFPICGTDNDCKKEGMEGFCINAKTENAKCIYKESPKFTVIVLNDLNCISCNTGNLMLEIKTRFPNVMFNHIDINSKKGINLKNKLGLKQYPAFIFNSKVEGSENFLKIKNTFYKKENYYILSPGIIKAYHLFDREEKKPSIILFGASQYPPVVEAIRKVSELIKIYPDFNIKILPYALVDTESKENFPNNLMSPGGIEEINENIRVLCIDSFTTKQKAIDYRLCRGFYLEQRYGNGIKENKNEWKKCIKETDINVIPITKCIDGTLGESLLKSSIKLGDSLKIIMPGPAILINNNFIISGYNSIIEKIIIELLKEN